MVIVGTLFFGFLCYLLLRIVDEFSEPMINDYASQPNTTVGKLYSKDGTAVALIFSKLAIAVTLATGASLMNGATATDGNVGMIQGSATLLLAAFMPFALTRVIPMMEGAVAGEGVALPNKPCGSKIGAERTDSSSRLQYNPDPPTSRLTSVVFPD